MTNAPISIYIANLGKYNEGELVGEWVDLPISKEELYKVFKRVSLDGQYGEIFLSDYESSIEGITRYISEHTPIGELNTLASALNGLNDSEVEIYQSMLEAGIYPVNSIKSLINLTNHLDEMTLVDDIEDEDDLVALSLQGKDVYVYGIRNSHLGKPFTSTSYLMGLADHIREVITLCDCKSKATRNIYTGASISSEIEVGNNFMGVCSSCYLRRTEDKWVDTLGEKYETR